jgi:DNA adenine methylase
MSAASTRVGARTWAKPFVKWAGGKTQLLPVLLPVLQSQPFERYHEAFVGGGAAFFALRAAFSGYAHLSDVNEDLVDAWRAVRDYPMLLIGDLQRHRDLNSREHFEEVRRNRPGTEMGRAARMVYLNKTAYNGLWRVNSKGGFNTPWGKYVNPNICDSETIHACHHALKGVHVHTEDFRKSALRVKPGDLWYADPPYVPTSGTSNFVGYGKLGFGERDQGDLANEFRRLAALGARCVLSNSDCSWVRELYEGFNIRSVSARRNVNSKGDKRGPVGEVIVTNF